jgi:uncharacterized protein (TIGR02996 family)
MSAKSAPGERRRNSLAFLEAIKETPGDDMPRLILADWLEERGGLGRIPLPGLAEGRLASDPEHQRLAAYAADLLAARTAWQGRLRSCRWLAVLSTRPDAPPRLASAGVGCTVAARVGGPPGWRR